MGDDVSDDAMFNAVLHSIGSASPATWKSGARASSNISNDSPQAPIGVKAFTVSVGRKVSAAEYYVNDVEVREPSTNVM